MYCAVTDYSYCICGLTGDRYPIGSFFGSVLANLLPAGVGSAVVRRRCPKIYVPNTGHDPEMEGWSIACCAARIVEMVRADAGLATPVSDIINFVVVDSAGADYAVELDRLEIEAMGIQVLDLQLTAPGGRRDRLDPDRTVAILVSMCG